MICKFTRLAITNDNNFITETFIIIMEQCLHKITVYSHIVPVYAIECSSNMFWHNVYDIIYHIICHIIYHDMIYMFILDTRILQKLARWRLVWDIESEGSSGGM